MADDAGIGEAAGDVVIAETGDLVEVEAGEGGAEVFAFPQDRQPGQARLEAFQADLLEQPDIVGDRTAPFIVVVAAIVLQPAMPEAAVETVVSPDQAFGDHVHAILPNAGIRLPFVHDFSKPAANPSERFTDAIAFS